ncbi:MAG: FAD-dependent oxidoreductase [Actinomycetes bacterium]
MSETNRLQPIRMYGTAWCPDCQRAKQFLSEQRVPYDFVDVDGDDAGRAVVEEVNEGKLIIPVLIFADGTTLVEPSNAELAGALGLQTQAQHRFYSLIVIGSGPAGLTTAIYAAREGIPTLVIESSAIGGAIGVTDQVDNFPGFPDGVRGADFADRLRRQAERFGVEILSATEVVAVSADGDQRVVRTGTGAEYSCHALLLATGSTYRRLGIPGEEDFIGSGVHFCATCDGAFYRNQAVVVIGGGNSATEESLFLTTLGEQVTLVTNTERLTAGAIAVQKVEESPAITIRTRSMPVEFVGDAGKLTGVVVDDLETGERSTLATPAAFVFAGLTPNSTLASELVDVDEQGFILSDSGMQTSLPGVFVAGDVRSGSTKQAASAAGEGAAAAIAIRRYLEPFGMSMRPNVVDVVGA